MADHAAIAQELSLPAAIHLAAVAPAVAIGVTQLLMRKGTRLHKSLGWIWVLVSLGAAIWHIRRGNVRAHKRFMVGTLLGLAGAGLGALAPGRFLTILLF